MVRAFVFVLSALWTSGAFAKAAVSVQVDPSRSRNGENVNFKISVESPERVQVSPPQLPVFNDWEVINSYQSSDVSSRIVNGSITSTYRFEFSYLMRPLRQGRLSIPSLRLMVGNELRNTAPTEVDVDTLPNGGASRPRMQGNAADQDQDALGTDPSVMVPENLDAYPVPERETFFLRGEPSKTVVYEGELIVLSYALYQKNIELSNAEMDKFPDFKGFLKEDLFIPKTWNRQPVLLKGERYNRTELIRYALFPLQSGTLDIGQLVFRADTHYSVQSIIGNLITGQPIPSGTGPIPMRKVSPVIKIVSKPLPPQPPELKAFTGGVGQFQMEVLPPGDILPVGQPFSVALQLRGRGNLKIIEAPPLTLPEGFEIVDVKNIYKYNEDASGEKTFEYLILPSNPGDFEFPGLELSYFEPDLAQYQTVRGAPFKIRVSASSTPPLSENKAAADSAAQSIGTLRVGPQSFRANSKASLESFLVHPAFLLFQLLLFLGALGWLFYQRRVLDRNQYFAAFPWEKTMVRIKASKEWPLYQLADLVELWMSERLLGLLKAPHLYAESHRDDFMYSLRAKVHPSSQAPLSDLKAFWEELDLLRFAGSQKQNEKMTYGPLVTKAQNIYAAIEKVYGVGA